MARLQGMLRAGAVKRELEQRFPRLADYIAFLDRLFIPPTHQPK